MIAFLFARVCREPFVKQAWTLSGMREKAQTMRAICMKLEKNDENPCC